VGILVDKVVPEQQFLVVLSVAFEQYSIRINSSIADAICVFTETDSVVK
jgi:hypothetical protein